MSYKKKRKEKNQTNIYKIDKQRFNRSNLVNLNKNLKISLLNGQKLNYKSFEIYFEKVRGRRNRRSCKCTTTQKVILVWRRKKAGKKKKRRREGGKNQRLFRKFIAGHPFGERRIPTGRASIGPNVNVRCG